jgi:hypothetical protein
MKKETKIYVPLFYTITYEQDVHKSSAHGMSLSRGELKNYSLELERKKHRYGTVDVLLLLLHD